MESDIPVVKKSRKKLWIAVAVVLALAIFFGTNASHSKTSASTASSSPSPKGAKISYSVFSVVPLDSAHVRVYINWTNSGTSPGTETCVIQATSYSQYGDQIGSGTDSTGPNGNLAPGQSQKLYQDIVITHNASAGVTSTKDIKISKCS